MTGRLAGRSISFGANPDDAREALMGKLGDTNFQKNGISFGRVAGGNEPHALDSEYVSVKGVAGQSVYTVRHSRGHVPGFVACYHYENTTSPLSQYNVSGYDKGNWTASTAKVLITPVGGASLAGAEFTVMIGGS